MKQNIGSTDKIIRIILGIVIVALGYYYKSWWGLIAVIPFLTAFISFCPLYPIFSLSTKKEK
jgi:sulfite exporter TauE/SafE